MRAVQPRSTYLLRYMQNSIRMGLKVINSKDAGALDRDLMDAGGFSIDQLMELAGLSVSQAVYRVHPPEKGKNILVGCGPGNNGGDGLVAARHLVHYGYNPTVYHPKQGRNEIYDRLKTQLRNLSVPFTDDFAASLKNSDLVLDSFFGFSFKGPIRDPYTHDITLLEQTDVPVFSVDAPSSWEIETGPPASGPGSKFMPQYLISLTAAKPLVRFFTGRHFLGGRFLTPGIAQKYNLDLPDYKGIDQVVEVETKPERL